MYFCPRDTIRESSRIIVRHRCTLVTKLREKHRPTNDLALRNRTERIEKFLTFSNSGQISCLLLVDNGRTMKWGRFRGGSCSCS